MLQFDYTKILTDINDSNVINVIFDDNETQSQYWLWIHDIMLSTYTEICYFEKVAKNTPHFPRFLNLVFIFLIYHSKNMNKKLNFGHNMHYSKTHWMMSKSFRYLEAFSYKLKKLKKSPGNKFLL